MKVEISSSCAGCGLCVSVCPNVFVFDKNYKACTKEGVEIEDYAKQIESCVSSCPAEAIKVIK
jgi:ferredoxin